VLLVIGAVSRKGGRFFVHQPNRNPPNSKYPNRKAGGQNCFLGYLLSTTYDTAARAGVP